MWPSCQLPCLCHPTQGDNYGNLKFPFKSEGEPLYGNMGAQGESQQEGDGEAGDGDSEVRHLSSSCLRGSDLLSDYIPQNSKAPPLPQKP